MKTLAFSKPLVLVLVGLPGAGKSFFARQFAEMFSSPLVSYDRLRFELFLNPQHSAEEYDFINRLATYQVGELFKTKRSFMIDGGNQTKAERQALVQRASKQGYDVLFIWVQIDTPSAKVRSLHRTNKTLDDKYSLKMTDAQFEGYVKKHVTPAQENHVVISGKHAFSTQAKMVLRRLSMSHVQEAESAHTQVKPTERRISPVERPAANRRVIIS